MATHYKGERIDELLGEIATLQEKLKQNADFTYTDGAIVQFSQAYTALALAKAKLTALQGDE